MDSIKWESTLPNKLTLARIASVIPFVVLYRHGFVLAALLLFVAAAATDLLDGFIAKKWNCGSEWGVIGDPVADKLLCLSAFVVCFSHWGNQTWFAAPMLVVLAYDIAVIRMRNRASRIKTLQLARLKTAALMIGLATSMLLIVMESALEHSTLKLLAIFRIALVVNIAAFTLWFAAALAIACLILYAHQHWRHSIALQPAE